MSLTNKKILIISPQAWGRMLISKHHYATELALRGNEVYFLNPPNKDLSQNFIVDIGEIDNLFIVHHKLNFSYKLKFKLPSVFYWLMKKHISKMLSFINKDFDIIWSFDLGHVYPFEYFNKNSIKIFHPVDEPNKSLGLNAEKNCDIIFSTTPEILNKFSNINVPKYFINHGLKKEFLLTQKVTKDNNIIRVGFSGNLLRSDIDRNILIEIIENNPNIEFNLWGSYNILQSNISGDSNIETIHFIKKIKSFKNTILYGVKSTTELAEEYKKMDAFLICYKVITNKFIGENYHKTLEFMSTGKVIISHNFSTYRNKPNLVQMNPDSIDNSILPNLFNSIINNLDVYNKEEFEKERVEFAKKNTYSLQIERIEKALNENNLFKK